ncbi:MAG: Holliday junction branch migration protein RuvA [Lysobacterales bacterium]
MISRLAGTLLEIDPPNLVVDCGGVGYEVEAPTSVFDTLPQIGQPVEIRTHLQVSQDAQTLYGFSSLAERTLFRQLLKVSGIGAKLALTILSGASGEELARYVADGDVASLTRLPGIGKKTAERIIIEMRDKLEAMPALPAGVAAGASSGATATGAAAEAASALKALGYKPAEVQRMVREAAGPDLNAEDIIRKALQSKALA